MTLDLQTDLLPPSAPPGSDETTVDEIAERLAKPATSLASDGSASGLIVTLLEHPAGSLLRIEHEGGSITLDRAETWALYLELQNKIGAMPFKL